MIKSTTRTELDEQGTWRVDRGHKNKHAVINVLSSKTSGEIHQRSAYYKAINTSETTVSKLSCMKANGEQCLIKVQCVRTNVIQFCEQLRINQHKNTIIVRGALFHKHSHFP